MNTAHNPFACGPNYSLDVEECLLGAILVEPDALKLAIDAGVKSEHFFTDKSRLVWGGFIELGVVRGLSMIDVMSMAELFRKSNDPDAPSPAYFAALLDKAPIGQNVEYFIDLLLGMASARAFVEELSRLSRRLLEVSSTQEVQGVYDELKLAIKAAEDRMGPSANRPPTAEECIVELTAHIESIQDESKPAGLNTGLESIDKPTGGFMPADLIVVAARTSLGKTAFGVHVALRALTLGKRVGFFSLEMPRTEVTWRFVQNRGGLNSLIYRGRKMLDADFNAYLEAAGVHARQLLTVFEPKQSRVLSTMLRNARREHRFEKFGLIVVDYIGLMRADFRRYSNRLEEIAEVSMSLKELAVDLSVPVVVLAQINREGAKEKAMPELHHIRDSGSIEQDADMVLMLHQDVQEKYWLKIGKARGGACGVSEILFDKPTGRFSEPHRYVYVPAQIGPDLSLGDVQ